MTADPRARWAAQLSAPADATADDARAAFLRALPSDLLPPPEQVAALNTLAGAAVPTGPDDTVEQLLRDEVDALAADYWALAPAERLIAWADLSRRGAAPVRLRELEPGLDVTPPPLADPVAEELAGLIRTLFVLPPRGRAVRRNTWLMEHAADAGRWRSALAVVQRDAPALAALEPHLRAALGPGMDAALAARVEGASSPPLASAPAPTARAPEPASRAPANTGWKAGPALGGGALFGLFILIRLVSMLGRTDTKPSHTPPNVPNYSQPATPSYTMPSFTAAQVSEFQRYEREEAAGRNPEVPLAYPGWRLAGRPPAATTAPGLGPVGRRVRLDGLLIAACQNYERTGAGQKPARFDDWVAAGKPTADGVYDIPQFDPLP